MSELIDISRPLFDGTPPWPGDTPFEWRLTWKIAEGASVNVGAFSMSSHGGTHADAPFHFQAAAPAVDALNLGAFVGPAVVLNVVGAAVISLSHLAPAEESIRACRRVLFRTDAWTDPTSFPLSIPTMERDVPGRLGELGVVLVGLDVPSADEIESRDLANHHALAAAGIVILESLDLRVVQAGVYELIALPLKIEGGDASPVRAVLRK